MSDPTDSPTAVISLLRGTRVLRTYPVHGDSATIGSGDGCTLRAKGKGIAELHATLYIEGEEITLVPEPDCAVAVNGEPVDFAIPGPDDRIVVGPLTLKVELGAGGAATAAEPPKPKPAPKPKPKPVAARPAAPADTAVTLDEPAEAPAPEIPRLVVHAPGQKRRKVRLRVGRFTLGAGKCSLKLAYEGVADQHAVLHVKEDGSVIVQVRDARTAPVHVNGKRVKRAARIGRGDRMQVGTVRLSLHFLRPAAPAPAPAPEAVATPTPAPEPAPPPPPEPAPVRLAAPPEPPPSAALPPPPESEPDADTEPEPDTEPPGELELEHTVETARPGEPAPYFDPEATAPRSVQVRPPRAHTPVGDPADTDVSALLTPELEAAGEDDADEITVALRNSALLDAIADVIAEDEARPVVVETPSSDGPLPLAAGAAATGAVDEEAIDWDAGKISREDTEPRIVFAHAADAAAIARDETVPLPSPAALAGHDDPTGAVPAWSDEVAEVVAATDDWAPWEDEDDDDDDAIDYVAPFDMAEVLLQHQAAPPEGKTESYCAAHVVRIVGGDVVETIGVLPGKPFGNEEVSVQVSGGRALVALSEHVHGDLVLGGELHAVAAQQELAPGDSATLQGERGTYRVLAYLPPRAPRSLGLKAGPGFFALCFLAFVGHGAVGVAMNVFQPADELALGSDEEAFAVVQMEAEPEKPEVKPKPKPKPVEQMAEKAPEVSNKDVQEVKERPQKQAVNSLLKTLASNSGAPGASDELKDLVSNIDAIPNSGGTSAGFDIAGAIAKLPGDGVNIARKGGGGDLATLGTDKLSSEISSLGAARTGNVRGKVTKVASQMKVQGSLSAEEISRVINQHVNEVQQCYEAALLKTPGLSGRITFDWTITMSGDVSNVRIRASTLSGSDVAECVSGKIKRWKFPQPTGAEVTITYPFLFRSVAG